MVSWYGLEPKQNPIIRPATYDSKNKKFIVELYPESVRQTPMGIESDEDDFM